LVLRWKLRRGRDPRVETAGRYFRAGTRERTAVVERVFE
jgi:hypothetical protein